MTCKLCDKSVPTIKKSHIYSKFLFRNMVDIATNKKVILFDKKTFKINEKPNFKPRPFEKLLCNDCEQLLSNKYETPVSKLLYGDKQIYAIPHILELDDKSLITESDLVGIESRTVKNFILSLIWRASISTITPFDRFKLKQYDNDKIKNIVYNDLDVKDYPIFVYNIAKYQINYITGNIKIKDLIAEPFIIDDKCCIVLNGLMFLIDISTLSETYIRDNKIIYAEIKNYKPFSDFLNFIFKSLII